MTLYVKDIKLACLEKRGEKMYFMQKIIIFIVQTHVAIKLFWLH